MNLVMMMLVNLVGQKVSCKYPVSDKVPAGSKGKVVGATHAGRIIFVEFPSDPGVRHRLDRLNVDQVIETMAAPAPGTAKVAALDHVPNASDFDEIT